MSDTPEKPKKPRPPWLTPGTSEFFERERLFRWTVLDLQGCTETAIFYHRLRIALILRTLLLDGAHSLGIQIASAYDMKLSFEVGTAGMDMIDPYSPNLPGRTWPSQVMTLDEFIGMHLLTINGEAVTAHRLIDNMAHVLGAAHAAPPKELEKDAADAMLAYNRWNYRIGGKPMLPHLLRQLGAVVLRSMQPLLAELRSRWQLAPEQDTEHWKYD